MLWRLAARALTGPVAFFVAGVVDIAAFGLITLRARLRSRSGWCRRNLSAINAAVRRRL